MLKEQALPKMVKIHQKFDPQRIEAADIPRIVAEQLGREEIAGKIKAGAEVAITVGSRGLANVALITKSIAAFVKSRGGVPFAVPAMGSHGGATAEGQKALIARYGVTEDFIGCEIRSSMETVEIGVTEEGQHVRLDKNAAGADAIIVCGRVKAHTDFRGPYESGIMKMMAIGLGKQEGASVTHEAGFWNMHKMVPMFGRCIMKNTPVICGLALIENAYHETCKIESLTPQEVIDKEPKLLEYAKSRMAKILIDSCDVLIVDKIGKEISGDGLDPNVSGGGTIEGGLTSQRIVILDLTEETHGAAMGMGAAHVSTRRLYNKIDYEATYVNALTCRCLYYANSPLIMETDEDAVKFAVMSCGDIDKKNPRIIRIEDTIHINDIWVSEALVDEAKKNPNIEIVGEKEDFPFDKSGNLW
jgi:hypothetical protein